MTILQATVAYPGGEPRDGKFGPQVSASFFVRGGEKVYVNCNSPGSKAALALQGLEKGQEVTLVEKQTAKGRTVYELVEDEPMVTGATPPPKKDKKAIIEERVAKTRYFMERAIVLVTAMAIESELQLSDGEIMDNARQIATGWTIDLKGKI